ncbi:hypothetical protein Snoj_00710 [Streptomyces nojiriensis]|uniref:Uncharacterized protein n=1 Tax=Streptomyces nojiriensis TaxID=66374 RepID=A0ABQ3SDE5_9ACTN|nr:hypothetical protein Snoj_00710 [Streptomyces nojiriensis]
MQYATTAASARPSNSPEPAAPAAGARAAKIPAPIIDPRPITTASNTPRCRFNPPVPEDPDTAPIARSPTTLQQTYRRTV